MESLKVVIFAGIIAQASAATASALPTEGVFDNMRLTCMCLVGALMGAFLAVALFPGEEVNQFSTRRLSLKFGASMVCGVAFTPMNIRMIHWMFGVNWYQSDLLIGLSATSAMLAVYTVHKLAPQVERWMANRQRPNVVYTITDIHGDVHGDAAHTIRKDHQ